MPGDEDGDRDENNLLSLSTTRLERLEAGAGSADCWGICSPEDCSGRESGSEVELEVPGGYLERFDILQETVLELYIDASCG